MAHQLLPGTELHALEGLADCPKTEDAVEILFWCPHNVGKVCAGTVFRKMVFEEAPAPPRPFLGRDCSMSWPLALAQYE